MKYVSSSHCELSTAHLQFVFMIIGAFLIVDTTTISIDYATKQHQSLQEVGQVESMAILDNSHQLQKRNNMRLCGMKLVQFISKICNDCVMIPEYSETVILLDKKSQRQSGNLIKRSGLSEQCCNRRCNYYDLKMYCCSNN